MDIRKVLADLQYRIQSTREDDPERENAIRLRDRLLAKKRADPGRHHRGQKDPRV